MDSSSSSSSSSSTDSPIEVDLQVTAFIKVNYVDDPLIGITGLIFEGDDRGFSKTSNAYRMRSKITVLPDSADSASGVKPGSESHDPGTTVSYEKSTSLSGGVISSAAEADTVKGKPKKVDWDDADVSGLTATVTRINSKKVSVVFVGGANNPLVSGSPDIDWDITITIDVSTPGKIDFTVKGNGSGNKGFDGFPSYDVYINDLRAVGEHPASGVGLGALFPPLDTVVDASGQFNQ